MSNSKKQSRKEKLDQWRAQQRAAARAKLPLPDDQMRAMFAMLRESLATGACDHTRRRVEQWAVAEGYSYEEIGMWCDDHGGFCDCQVVNNCEQQWLDAIADVNW